MKKFKKKFNDSPAQALVEFALVISAVLMMIFLIIESARILWAWNTVQHAAREGARHAITGSFDVDPTDPDDCVIDFGADKFRQPSPGRDVCTDLRVASVINTSHQALTGLPLDEVSNIFEDDNYYNIEVWGANEQNQLMPDFAGIPENPVIVRVYYQVPIITPFFRPIRETIPVFGQEVLNNESFGQLGTNEGAALPPNLPPLPTPGVTPSPTPTPIVTDTPTPVPITETPTETPIPICEVEFEGYVVETQNFVWVTGDLNTTVNVVNLTTGGNIIGSAPMDGPFDGHACDGFVTIGVDPNNMTTGDVLAAVSSDGSTDTTIVLSLPPTNTPTPSNTPQPTSTSTPTITPVPTNTPSDPYIILFPECGTPLQDPDSINFTVGFINWPTNQSLTIMWEGAPMLVWQAGQHAGSFSQAFTQILPMVADTYTVTAVAGGGHSNSKIFTVPCSVFPTPTPGGGPTATPAPPDLIVIGTPAMLSTPPIVAYQPVQFSVFITNDGDIDVNSQFFVDLYLDPNPSLILSTTIPITESDGYSAVSSLAGGQSRVITITSQLGFTNEPITHSIYSMVDSLEQVFETDETNNISEPPFIYAEVTPAATPTPTPPPTGDDIISGAAYTFEDDLIPQFRAAITLIDDSTGAMRFAETDVNGFYIFNSVSPPATTYSLTSCVAIDGNEWFGFRSGIIPPDTLAVIVMFEGPCP